MIFNMMNGGMGRVGPGVGCRISPFQQGGGGRDPEEVAPF